MTNSKTQGANALDQAFRAFWARRWLSVAPESQVLAWQDWLMQLALSPGTQANLARLALTLRQECVRDSLPGVAGEAAPENNQKAATIYDHRFSDDAWDHYPFRVFRQSFLAQQQWWEAATNQVRGVNPHHRRLVSFAAKQWLDMWSPGNFFLTNPTVLAKTVEEGGANLVRGLQHFWDDFRAQLDGSPPAGTENFQVGKDVALTPGKVVLRNQLMELIQYQPTTDKVYAEPILIVPAWIMKYYILDLSAHNSLIKFLVDQGHTVFCISWKNPRAEDRDLGMDDYLTLGWQAALDAVNAIVPNQKVHATGYCLGGSLLSIAAAAMARENDNRLASITLLASLVDFSEPGELGLFIDEAQVTLLEAQMAKRGYLRADQMAGAFQMLRSYDLLWSRMVNEYLLGNRGSMFDLMAWNADATRMPAKMHSQYLRRLYLNNELSAGRYPVGGRPVSLADIRLPMFCVGTASDHVAPWKSVYKVHLLIPAEITFVLASGGHNAGIITPPDHPRRRYQMATRTLQSTQLSAEDWQASVPSQQGSWWPAWQAWLAKQSVAEQTPPAMGAAQKGYPLLADAPGQYVLERA